MYWGFTFLGVSRITNPQRYLPLLKTTPPRDWVVFTRLVGGLRVLEGTVLQHRFYEVHLGVVADCRYVHEFVGTHQLSLMDRGLVESAVLHVDHFHGRPLSLLSHHPYPLGLFSDYGTLVRLLWCLTSLSRVSSGFDVAAGWMEAREVVCARHNVSRGWTHPPSETTAPPSTTPTR